MKTADLFDLSQTLAKPLLEKYVYPWQALGELCAFIKRLGESLPKGEYERVGDDIWAAKDAVIAPSASVTGPAVIGHSAEIRHCAYVRGGVIIGDFAVAGNSTELKNCVLFNRAQAPHYNYIGDSILGFASHMGAAALTSNLKGDKTNIAIRFGGETYETGMRKLGAIIGDGAEIGCSAVLNPGTIIGKNTQVYPLCNVRGVIPPNGILKNSGEFVPKKPRQ